MRIDTFEETVAVGDEFTRRVHFHAWTVVEVDGNKERGARVCDEAVLRKELFVLDGFGGHGWHHHRKACSQRRDLNPVTMLGMH